MRPVNENASYKTCKLLEYLQSVAGKKIVTGQHTQTNAMEEIDYIRNLTGREPKLRGFELLSYSPNINYNEMGKECLTEIEENRDTVETALSWAQNSDGIITFTFHWFSPIGGRDKSFYTENTDYDARKVLCDGTAERKAFFSDLDAIADILKRFRDLDIPVLWRPFHESEGTWFWWGAYGPEVAGELYKLMYHYFVDVHELNNLLWVWNCMSDKGYPGDEYVDIISLDTYLPSYIKTDYAEQYNQLIEWTSKNKVAALAEVGYIPDVNMLQKSHVPWAYYMCWSREFGLGDRFNSKESLMAMYNSDYAEVL